MHAMTRQFHKLRVARRLMLTYATSYGIAPHHQLAELLFLWARNGIGPLEYYLLGLFRPAVPWPDKLDTVSGAWYWKQVQKINRPELRVLATNKIASYFMLRSCHIPTPKVHGVLNRATGLTFDGEPLRDAADLEALARDRSLAGICLKPISAWSGRGFVKVGMVRDADTIRARIQPSGPTVPLDALCREYLDEARYGSYLIQDVLEQHPAVARFHPQSLNTIRTWMHQTEPGRWEMYCANIRMGVGDMTIDNNSAGGIGAPVDVASGRLGTAILRGINPEQGDTLREYAVHPTTGVRIEGEMLPMWQDVITLCRRTCSLFPFFGFMGVDVGMGVEHPWIVEVEADPHSVVQLYCGKGLRPMMGPLLDRGR